MPSTAKILAAIEKLLKVREVIRARRRKRKAKRRAKRTRKVVKG